MLFFTKWTNAAKCGILLGQPRFSANRILQQKRIGRARFSAFNAVIPLKNAGFSIAISRIRISQHFAATGFPSKNAGYRWILLEIKLRGTTNL
jgi:hypothetical protein